MNKTIISTFALTFTLLSFTPSAMAAFIWQSNPEINSSTESNSTSIPTEKVQVFTINKMTCKMCHITVRKAMENVDGVIKAIVDYETKTATVLFNPTITTIDAIALASTHSGYPATPEMGY